jgi:uncharacterized membrane protein
LWAIALSDGLMPVSRLEARALSTPVHPLPPTDPTPDRGLFGEAIAAIRRRIISGLVLALPIAVTFWILYWLYTTFQSVVLRPLTLAVAYLLGVEGVQVRPFWWEKIVAPILAIAFVLIVLYFLGLFFRSRLHRMVDWIMLHVPVVMVIYKTVNNLVETFDPNRGMAAQFKRVVLVEFPQPGMRSVAFVTNAIKDEATGRTILCVCVLTGVVPPTGFTLFVPEESVTDVDWTVNETIQVILTGGLTSPGKIQYFSAGIDAGRVEGLIREN